MYNKNNLIFNPKKRIEEFQIVETRDGVRRLVLDSPFLGKILVSDNGYISLKQYDKELCCCQVTFDNDSEVFERNYRKFDIMKIFDKVLITSVKSLEKYLSSKEEEELFCIWKRQEQE
jgi:hypothetical protein